MCRTKLLIDKIRLHVKLYIFGIPGEDTILLVPFVVIRITFVNQQFPLIHTFKTISILILSSIRNLFPVAGVSNY